MTEAPTEEPSFGAWKKVILAAVLAWVVVFAGVIAWVAGKAGGPAYPREKAAAFARLKAVGPAAVVQEARDLLRANPGGKEITDRAEMPPSLRKLEPVYVRVAGEVFVKLGGMGDAWGFTVCAAGAAPSPSKRMHRVADGLWWRDSGSAPDEMLGLPPNWTPR